MLRAELPPEIRVEIERLFDENPARYTKQDARLFQQFKDALNAGEIRAAEPDPARASGWRVNAWVKKGILLGFRMGKIVDMSIDAERQPFFDKSTYPVKTLRGGFGRAHRAGRIEHSRRLLRRQRRHVHAADVHQRGRVRGRRHDGRFARAGRQLRADRQEMPHLGGDRRSAACSSRWARCR